MDDSRRNLLAVWPGLFAVSAGLMAVIPILPLYIEERFGIVDPTELRSWSAIIFGVAPLTAGCVGPIWGGLGDRVGRKAMVIRAMLAIAIVTALMPLAPSPTALAVTRAVQGAFAGYIAPAMALVSASTPPGRQGWTLSRLQTSLAMGTLCGPPLGAEAAAWIGRGGVFYLCSGLAWVAVAFAVFGVREDRSGLEPRPAGTGVARDLAQQLRGILRNRVFLSLLALLLLMRLGQNMAEPFIALFVRALGPLEFFASGGSSYAVDRTTAVAFMTLALAQLVMTPVWGRLADRYGPLRCLAWCSIGLGATLGGVSTSPSSGAFLGWRLGTAVFMAGALTLGYAAATKRVLPSRRSLAFSLIQSCTQFGLAAGPYLGDRIVVHATAAADEAAGLRLMFRIAAGACLCAGVGMFALRRSKHGNLDNASPPATPRAAR